MTRPVRLQLSRKKGFRLQEQSHARNGLSAIVASGQWKVDIATLRGKNLACWCPLDHPCHADVLLELANRPRCEEVRP